MPKVFVALLAVWSATTAASAQDRYRYEQYGTELRRIPGYGTLDAPLYRGESTHPKQYQPRDRYDSYDRRRQMDDDSRYDNESGYSRRYRY